MENKPLEEVVIYSQGIVACSVCAPISMPVAEVEAQVNEMSPIGPTLQWHVSPDKTFLTGEPNPFPCPDNSNRLHYLLVC